MTTTAQRPAVRSAAGRVLPFPISGQELILLGVIVLVWVILAIATPNFLTPQSLQPLFTAVAPIAIMGVGMTFIIITGGIDVSVAGMLMVCAVVTAQLLRDLDIPLAGALAVSIAIGAVLGSLNGFLIAFGKVQAIIITFGTANLFTFLGLRIFNSRTVDGLPNTLNVLGRGEAGRFAGLPISFWLTLVITAIAWWYLRYAAGGRHYYAIGSDRTAAALAGIPVRGRTVSAYAITGVLVGLAACISVANGPQTLYPTIGVGTELETIAAVVIGGTSITGGRGSVLGTLLGAILVQTVTSGVNQVGLPTQLAQLFVGAFIIIAVGADLIQQRLRRDR